MEAESSCERRGVIRFILCYLYPLVILITRLSLGCANVVKTIFLLVAIAVDNIFIAPDFIRYLSFL